MLYKFSFLLSFLFLVSCGAISANDKKITVQVETQDNIKDIDRVLTKRLNNIYGGFFSNIKSTIKNKLITYKIHARGDVTEETLRYYLETQGQLSAYLDKSKPWFTSTDIINTEASYDEVTNEPVLRFSLSKEAAIRMKEKTTSNIGKILILELDGKILTEVRIASPLSKHIQINFTRSALINYRTAMLLRTGPLPEKVQLIKLDL